MPLLLFGLSILGESVIGPYFGIGGGVISTGVEVMLALWVAVQIRALVPSQPNWCVLIPLLIALGDLFYGVSNYLLRLEFPNTLKCLAYVLPYLLSLLLLTIGLGKIIRRVSSEDRLLRPTGAVLVIGVLVATVITILIPALVHKSPPLSHFLAIVTVVFSILESFVTAAAAALLIGAVTVADQLLLFGILFMHLSDLAIRYQSVRLDLMGMSAFENGWCLGIALVSTAVIELRQRPMSSSRERWTPLFSLRGLTVGLVLSSLIILWILLIMLYRVPLSASLVSGGLLILSVVFTASIVVANVVTRQISGLALAVRDGVIHGHERRLLLPHEIRKLVGQFICLMQAVEARRSETMKLSAQVVHDLGTPISVLRTVPPMFADATKDCTQCSAAIREPLEAVSLAAQSVQRVSAGLLRRRRQMHDLMSVRGAIMDAISLVRTSYPNRKIETEVLTADDGPIVDGLSRVITNLVKNSIEASSESSAVLVSLEEKDGEFVLSIRDSGHGIPKSILERIYAGDVVTTKSEGNGLGLAGMLDWVNKNSFQQKIVSRQGFGTTVTLYLGKKSGELPCLS